MSAKHNEVQGTAAWKKMGSCSRANGKDGCRSAPRMLGWYVAQPVSQGLKYLLTIHGYVLV
jgi:hypothetical protein